ncbi:hypothetical protein LEP1GSC012_2617 [Leptospira interrogans serovar Valbuzzi str. Valbuzzi]|nr:hypothetical protein LEP1GSC012_2617 [Leptospira interrogans serovar Valbuzzi str. Valbuzzi]
MNLTERAFYGSPFWAQKGTFFKCSDKNESFYLQKVCFSDKENLPHPKIGKTQHNGSLRIALETQHNGSLRIALETQHNGSLRIALETQHNGSLRIALETQHNALYESRCGAGTKFYRGFVVTPTDLY